MSNEANPEAVTPTTLKPCPFCGSERLECNVYIRDGRAVHCKDCGGSTHAHEPRARERSIEKWNRRSPAAMPVLTDEQKELSFTHCVFIGDPPAPHTNWQDWCESRQYSGVTIHVTDYMDYGCATAISLSTSFKDPT